MQAMQLMDIFYQAYTVWTLQIRQTYIDKAI